MMIFGEKICGLDYKIRKGVYAVIFNSGRDKVMAVRNGHGHIFLPGGGIESNENHLRCLEREMLEETGYKVLVESYIGNANRYFKSRADEPLLSDAHFYSVSLSNKIHEATELDYSLEWINVNEAKNYFQHEHHFWAIKEALNK